MWRMPTRAEAIEILHSSRAETDELIAQLDDRQLRTKTVLGGGDWSIKDLIGHLTSWEERALAVATGKKRRHPELATADELNAAEIERKRAWSLNRVRDEAARVRAALISAIEEMDDERWTTKIQTGTGKSAMGLVLGKVLTGRDGLYAHDSAHRSDLRKSVRALQS